MKYLTSILLLLTTTLLFAQNDEITVVTESSCNCLSEIDINLEKQKRYEEIKSCITTSIIDYQIKMSLMPSLGLKNDSINKSFSESDTVSLENVNNIIIADKNFRQIEENLLANCDRMSALMKNEEKENEGSVSDKKKAIKIYNEGLKYFNNQEYDKAIKYFKKALKKDDEFAFAWDMLGYSYRNKNNFSKAIEYYKKSLTIDPYGRMPLMNIPIAYEYLKDYKEAIKTYKDFIKVFPNDPEGLYGIGRIYHLEGDYENALDNTMKAFILYNEINSPYARDAENNINIFYSELKEKNQLDLFKKMAKKYNIKFE